MRELMMALMSTKAEKGQGLVEYGLIIVLVALAVVVALTAVGGGVETVFNNIVARLGLGN